MANLATMSAANEGPKAHHSLDEGINFHFTGSPGTGGARPDR
ncbi:hypothetical protein MPL1032_20306 [Mesorhizobium plurifarium]|uniref:Uncharacterized protein n=1 Tax=Mesorhizobium plurifarium TaxID=69974 RepID=A0A0K2VX88_MESPL|nr:hypothetical protein MPL1032_20306 [Mesorhizobium plurifarium]